MAGSARLDGVRLRAELFFIHRTLGAVVDEQMSLLGDLDSGSGSASALIWRSLYSDCLRAVYSIAMADGVIYELELDWMRELLVAAGSHYTGAWISPYSQRPVDATSSRTFLAEYFRDDGPFGYGAEIRWRGHRLCHRTADLANREPLIRYSRLMRWLIDETCKASGVSQHDPRWRTRLPEIDTLLQALTEAGLGPEPEVERRRRVFGERKSRVFAPIQKAVSVYEADPFDVESIHREARDSFRKLLDQATSESRNISSGRTLLIVGPAGYGKTHLLRSFWSYVQEFGRGFVAYAQMDVSVDDYARYFLHQLVESLKCPYSGRPGGQTGLEELASGLVQLKGPGFVERVERLTERLGGPRSSLDSEINQLVDELLGDARLGGVDPDLVRVLLYVLCGEQRTKHRVYQYLCCDEMTNHDRSLIGNIAPRTAREDRAAMIRKLAQLAFTTRRAPLVLMLDQVERSGDAEQAMATFNRAIDTLLGIESQVGSVVVVIGCLSNFYDKALKAMGQSTLDRLIKDPPPARLRDQLSYEDVQAIVGHRLAWMFAEAGAIYRASEPVHPIPEAELRNRVGLRPRDILDWCHEFHERCVAGKNIIDDDPIERIASLWDAALEASRARALDEDGVLMLVAAAVRAYTEETGVSLMLVSHKDNLLRLQRTAGGQQTDLVISVTNRGPQAGSFGTQIKKLRLAARGGAIPIAVRTEAFPNGPKAVEAVIDLVSAGGRAICLDKQTLRTLLAHQLFQPAFSAEHIHAWRRSKRPIASLPSICEVFGEESPAETSSRGWPSNTAATG